MCMIHPLLCLHTIGRLTVCPPFVFFFFFFRVHVRRLKLTSHLSLYHYTCIIHAMIRSCHPTKNGGLIGNFLDMSYLHGIGSWVLLSFPCLFVGLGCFGNGS
ncbi:hypothetical protein BDV33DRAFT_160535 [Aspergillus novoparasiticus]|uniref:Uncharacterized protein n=1 Tax=Aspergillus novoparasiticus TaxID=986946 RepID=A0A5N6EI10_9EURO|nr:hypothetical protein BDV33DRAFT_160535 [Aspergillus novoparasiticus]